MSALSNLAALEAKHDGPIPKDELDAALKSQQVAWGEARWWQHYYEERLRLTLERINTLSDTDKVAPLAEKVEFFTGEINKYRAQADAQDWQQRNQLAAE